MSNRIVLISLLSVLTSMCAIMQSREDVISESKVSPAWYEGVLYIDGKRAGKAAPYSSMAIRTHMTEVLQDFAKKKNGGIPSRTVTFDGILFWNLSGEMTLVCAETQPGVGPIAVIAYPDDLNKTDVHLVERKDLFASLSTLCSSVVKANKEKFPLE